MLRLVLATGAAMQPFAGPILRRRLKRGKELPDRWREKLGTPGAARPDGPLIWLHAVGLGEVMALRGLIDALATARPDLNFLVTSTARSSAQVFANALPPRTIHQFLPLDMPGPVRAFLDHWHPDLAIWSEQDLWPRLVVETERRGVPQMVVNGRMDDKALKSRQKFGAAFRDLYGRFARILAQDDRSAANLRQLAPGTEVTVSGSLKSGAMALPVDDTALAQDRASIGPRPVWLLAPSHPEDEAVALAAHAALRRTQPDALLLIAPRLTERGHDIAAACAEANLPAVLRSVGASPDAETAVWIVDTFGEMGLWYRLARAALIGGSFSDIEGHNPWEAAALDCAILHGPRVANFAADYRDLDAAGGALSVADAPQITAALLRPDLGPITTAASHVRAQAGDSVRLTRDALLELLT